MTNTLPPIVDQWYQHLDKGQCFFVTKVIAETDCIEVQHFDGDLDEFSFAEWRNLDIDLCETPEDWSGPLDVDNPEDYGTEVTDTSPAEWGEEGAEFRRPRPEEGDKSNIDDYGEGFMVEDTDGRN